MRDLHAYLGGSNRAPAAAAARATQRPFNGWIFPVHKLSAATPQAEQQQRAGLRVRAVKGPTRRAWGRARSHKVTCGDRNRGTTYNRMIIMPLNLISFKASTLQPPASVSY